jgi:hypothetical protein
LLGLALAILGASCTGPADQSEARLEREILKVTPLGTSMAEVKVYVAKQGWKITEQSNTKGGSSGFLVATVAGSGTGWGDENRRARPKSTGSGGWSL